MRLFSWIYIDILFLMQSLDLLIEQNKDIIKTKIENLFLSKKLNYSSEYISKLIQMILKDIKANKKERLQTTKYFFLRHRNFGDSFYQEQIIFKLLKDLFNQWLKEHFVKISDTYIQNYTYLHDLLNNAQIERSKYWDKQFRIRQKQDQTSIKKLKIVKNDLQTQLDNIYKIIKNLPIGIITCNHDFKIKHWNPMITKITGFKKADILNENILNVFTSKSKNTFLSSIQTSRNLIRNLRLQIDSKSERQISVLVSINVFNYFTQNEAVYIISFIDMKDEEKIHTQSKQINHLHAIARLSGSIMHDIRNPINSIGLNTDVIVQTLRNNRINLEGIDNYINMIYLQIEQLKQTLNQYLGYSRLMEIELKPTEITSKLSSMILDMQLEACTRGINIIFKKPQDNFIIIGDWNQLHRVFLNIIRNSFDVTEKNGTIYIKIYQRKKNLFISIADEGPGINLDKLDHIFKPYYTTKISGTGLGLFIAKEIINVHNGKITCANNSDRGVSFIVSLPITDQGEII